MASYKLIQDIEAEDKILGPLTLRQFIFALAAAFLLYICFVVLTKGFAFLLVIFLPPALFCTFFAFPFGRDQPTEVWALAKLRFWFKPRRRLWNQSGVKELVTITVPKKIERVLTNGLSQTEVKSRLRALADTIDSRGWAVKNATSGTYAQPAADSDRLIDIGSLPQEVPGDEVPAADDILDAANNPIAQQFDSMIDRSSRSHRQQLMDQLNDIRQDEAVKQSGANGDAWFTNGSQTAAMPPAISKAAAADEAALSASLAARNSSRGEPFEHLRTVQPLRGAAAGGSPAPAAAIPAQDQLQAQARSQSQAAPPTAPAQDAAATGAVTVTDDPAILSLARNDDFNVATLAREARKTQGGDGTSRDEVVISLH